MGRAERRRLRLATAPKMCPTEALELELQRAKEIRADRHTFDPATARAATQQLHAMTCAAPMPPMNPLLSFVLTTSAIPSNPSLELIEGVLSSCEANIGLDQRQAARCLTLVIMDGYMHDESHTPGTKPKYKNGKLDEPSIAAYEAFKTALRAHIASQPYPHLYLVGIELPFRNGFAGAVHESMRFISTPYMMVMQHDWCFIRPLQHSVWQLVDIMERESEQQQTQEDATNERDESEDDGDETSAAEESHSSSSPSPALSPSASASPAPLNYSVTGRLPINYITFQSSTTVKYLEKDFHSVAKHVGPEVYKLHHYPVVEAATAASVASPPCADSVPLCPVFFWFDRNHLVRSSFYRDRVFGAYRFMRSAAFIEDTFGQMMLNILRGTQETHSVKRFTARPFTYYASYIYYTDGGLLPHVDHVHGRKFITSHQRERQFGGRDVSLQSKAAERERAARKEAERLERSEADEGNDLALDGMYAS